MAPSWFELEFLGDGPSVFSEDPATGLPMVTVEVEATDPRASGTVTNIEDFSHDKNDERYPVGGTSLRLVNDGGAWVGTSRFINGATTGADQNDIAGGFSEYTGEDGHEGLSMFTFMVAGPERPDGPPESVGFIVPTDRVSAMPPPPTAEEPDFAAELLRRPSSPAPLWGRALLVPEDAGGLVRGVLEMAIQPRS